MLQLHFAKNFAPACHAGAEANGQPPSLSRLRQNESMEGLEPADGPGFASPFSRLLEEEVVSNPTTKQCQGWGRTTAGTEGPREQGTVGESAGPQGGAACTPALAVGPADRTARDGWTDRREWASRWEAGTWSTSRTGRGLRFTWRAEDLAWQRSCHRHGHGHGQGGGDGAECRGRRTRWYGSRRRRESCSDTWDWLDGSVSQGPKRKGEIIPIKSEQKDQMIPEKSISRFRESNET
jgi:hypothetical protein